MNIPMVGRVPGPRFLGDQAVEPPVPPSTRAIRSSQIPMEVWSAKNDALVGPATLSLPVLRVHRWSSGVEKCGCPLSQGKQNL